MKNYIKLLILILTICQTSMAQDTIQAKRDSLSFASQKDRVNHLLEERTKRFGEYDLSLEKKTGVFGLFKTKGDMQKSIDILREVVLNDNNIFLETRKLLDLKDSESIRYQSLASEYDKQVSAYMKTITKLQNENDKLREEIASMETTDQGSTVMLFIGILIIIALIIALVYQYKWYNPKKITIQ